MIGSAARTTRQSHTREKIEPINGALVWRNPRVAAVVVTIWPHAVRGRGIPRPAQVAHRPEARPEPGDLPVSRERDTRFESPAFEAQLVPALDHARAVFQIVIVELFKLQRQDTVRRRHRVGVVPLTRQRNRQMV